MTTIQELAAAIEAGKGKLVKQLMERAIDEGNGHQEILNGALLPAMEAVSRKFKDEQFYVPEVILASHAMTVGTVMLEEYTQKQPDPIGRVVIGTVKGDLHNIGKNIVAMMLRGMGLEVFDLGYDVDSDAFIEKAGEVDADIICMSAMLTTTMQEMRKVVGKLENKKLRDHYIIMVGGAPITEKFARNIGADLYTPDAGSAAVMAREAVLAIRKKEKTEHENTVDGN